MCGGAQRRALAGSRWRPGRSRERGSPLPPPALGSRPWGYGQRDDLRGRLGDPTETVQGLSRSEAETLQSEANDNILVGNVLLGVGAAAMAAGLTWAWMGDVEPTGVSAVAQESGREPWLLRWTGAGLSLGRRF